VPAFDFGWFEKIIRRASNPTINTIVEQIKALNDFICKDEFLGICNRIVVLVRLAVGQFKTVIYKAF